MVHCLGCKEQATIGITITFAQGSGRATSVVKNVVFEVGDVTFVEDFIACELNGLDFILGNTFLDF